MAKEERERLVLTAFQLKRVVKSSLIHYSIVFAAEDRPNVLHAPFWRLQ